MISFADFIYEGKPFLGVATIAQLEKIIKPKFRILEFGSGGSTVWFAERCGLIRTHEGSFEVVEKIYYELQKRGLERKVEFVFNARYPRFITHYDNHTFDLILIDGRSRFVNLQASISSLKCDGWVLLDNAEQPKHKECIDLMTKLGWPRIDTRGYRKTAIASFWRKPIGKFLGGAYGSYSWGEKIETS
jgi:predicted O-methyltransferase YrrM